MKTSVKWVLLSVCLALCLDWAGCAGGGSTSSSMTSPGSPSTAPTSSGGSGGSAGGSSTTPSAGGSGTPTGGTLTSAACAAMSTGQGASLSGFRPFTPSNPWNQDISTAPVDPNSGAIIGYIGASIPVHPDFGSGLFAGSSMGIPYTIVNGSQGEVGVHLGAYGGGSDPGPMPIPSTAPVEGFPSPSGDQHVLVLDSANCFLYEMFNSSVNSDGTWNADSTAVWDLLSDEQRPYTWTSADAAGLPIFEGLVRYDEVASGQIQHALRFTLQRSRAAFIAPASHWAANSSDALAAPMGMRMRLKPGFDISSFSATNQAILKALKQYGMIMADNGSSMYISGTPDDRWDNNDLHQLSTLTAADFEVVQMGTVYTSANVPAGSAPTTASFTASSTSIAAGSTVTLSWSVSNASYVIVSPDAGAARGTSVVVQPAATTTYTLYATNAFGRTTATVTVSAH